MTYPTIDLAIVRTPYPYQPEVKGSSTSVPIGGSTGNTTAPKSGEEEDQEVYKDALSEEEEDVPLETTILEAEVEKTHEIVVENSLLYAGSLCAFGLLTTFAGGVMWLEAWISPDQVSLGRPWRVALVIIGVAEIAFAYTWGIFHTWETDAEVKGGGHVFSERPRITGVYKADSPVGIENSGVCNVFIQASEHIPSLQQYLTEYNLDACKHLENFVKFVNNLSEKNTSTFNVFSIHRSRDANGPNSKELLYSTLLVLAQEHIPCKRDTNKEKDILETVVARFKDELRKNTRPQFTGDEERDLLNFFATVQPQVKQPETESNKKGPLSWFPSWKTRDPLVVHLETLRAQFTAEIEARKFWATTSQNYKEAQKQQEKTKVAAKPISLKREYYPSPL